MKSQIQIMWTHPCILTNLSHNEAHRLLSRVKPTCIDGHMRWLNGYEFGLFGKASTCVLLAKTMQCHGKVYENMVRPNVQLLALEKGKVAQIRIMQTMYWDLDSVRAFLKRDDAHFHLIQGEYNGYEAGLLEDKETSRELGSIGRFYSKAISEIVSLDVLKKCPKDNIRAFYNI